MRFKGGLNIAWIFDLFLFLNIAWILILEAAQPNNFFLNYFPYPDFLCSVGADQGTDSVKTTINMFSLQEPKQCYKTFC